MTRGALLGLGLTALALTACTNDPFDPASLPNQPPVARIFVDHADSIAATSYNRARFAWSGSDVDGFVVGFNVAIDRDGSGDPEWIFTTSDDTTATYDTRADGTADPRLHVVAVDDRGATSDTVDTAFPLVNSRPILEYQEGYDIPTQSFTAVDLDLFAFDVDGDETLLPFVEYRFEGSDPLLSFDEDDEAADPLLGWVKGPRPRRSFTLRLRELPPGDPANGDLQTIYVRVSDSAGASATVELTWEVQPIRGRVLLVDDDDATNDPRDEFFRQAMQTHFGSAWNVVDASNIRGAEEVIDSFFEPFDAVIWYVRRQGRRDRIEAVQAPLARFLTTDRDPETPELEAGKLYLDFQYAGAPFNQNGLSTGIKDLLHVLATPVEGDIGELFEVIGQIGPELDVTSLVPELPDLAYVDTGGPTYFGLWSVSPAAAPSPLYAFESVRWNNRQCRPCAPVMATRWPDTGTAQVVVMSFQIELANVFGNAEEALLSIWSGQMGLAAQVVDPSATHGGRR